MSAFIYKHPAIFCASAAAAAVVALVYGAQSATKKSPPKLAKPVRQRTLPVRAPDASKFPPCTCGTMVVAATATVAPKNVATADEKMATADESVATAAVETLRGKVVVFTSVEDSYGHSVALDCARKGAKVLIGFIEESKAVAETVETLSGSSKVSLILLDLKSLQSCKDFAAAVLVEESKINFLVITNNGCHYPTDDPTETLDGFESSWQTYFWSPIVVIENLKCAFDKACGAIISLSVGSLSTANFQEILQFNNPSKLSDPFYNLQQFGYFLWIYQTLLVYDDDVLPKTFPVIALHGEGVWTNFLTSSDTVPKDGYRSFAFPSFMKNCFDVAETIIHCMHDPCLTVNKCMMGVSITRRHDANYMDQIVLRRAHILRMVNKYIKIADN